MSFCLLCFAAFFRVGDIYRCVYDNTAADQHFAITATVTCVTMAKSNSGYYEFAVEDGADAANLFYGESTNAVPVPGDTIFAQGVVTRRMRDGRPFARVTALEVLGHGAAPSPRPTTVREMTEGRFDCRFCRLRAIIRETAPSPYKRNRAYLTVVGDGCTISVWVRATESEYKRLRNLIGKEVDILGFCTPVNISELKYTGRQIRIYDTTNIQPAPPSTSATLISSVDKIGNLRPAEIDALGLHCATGCVCAIWGERHALLKKGDADFLQVDFIDPAPTKQGEIVEVVGFPESNFFRINLVNARWRKIGSVKFSTEPVMRLPNEQLWSTMDNHWPLRNLHGHLLKASGRIISMPKDGNAEPLIIENDITSLQVEVGLLGSLVTKLALGSIIEVTGICVIESEAWRSICPKFKCARIVPRSPTDVRILSTPSWWNPQRLLFVITGLFACLVGILIWNVGLRKASLRKGHQLAREQIKRAKAQLKTEERTRLAVELHDSLAQNLTGVSLVVDSVLQHDSHLDTESLHHLTIASRALQSCCTDLRNSIWDLRNESLDIADMNTAIRQVVGPNIGNADLKIRFNVSRKILDENMVHAILRIIRELTINAVRHGEATAIRIVGGLDGQNVLFCIKDNGLGFVPDRAPGITEGHFGLQGIRERIKNFNGQMSINTSPGNGAKITVKMQITSHD